MANKPASANAEQYTCKEGLNEYKPRFCIFGFQYVQVDGDIEAKPKDFEAIAVYSDMEDIRLRHTRKIVILGCFLLRKIVLFGSFYYSI